MIKLNFTFFLSVAFIVYIGNSLYSIGKMFFPQDCPVGQKCLGPFLARNPEMELKVYTSRVSKLIHVPTNRDLTLIWNYENFSFHEEVTK